LENFQERPSQHRHRKVIETTLRISTEAKEERKRYRKRKNDRINKKSEGKTLTKKNVSVVDLT